MKFHFPRLRYLGIGFISAWIKASYISSPSFHGRANLLSTNEASWTVAMLACLFALLLFGFLGYRHRAVLHKLIAPSLIICLIGIALNFSAGTFATTPALAAIGAALEGIGVGAFTVMWVDALSRLSYEEVELIVPLSAGIIALSALGMPLLTDEGASTLIFLFPICAAVSLFLTYRSVLPDDKMATLDKESESKPALGDRLRKLRIGVTLFVLCAALFWMGTTNGEARGLQAGISIAAGIATSMLFAWAFVRFSLRVDFPSLFHYFIPLVIIALSLSLLMDGHNRSLLRAVEELATSAIRIIAYLIAIRTVQKSSCTGFGGAVAILALVYSGSLVGNNLALGASAIDIASSWPIALCLIVAVALCVVIAPVPLRQIRSAAEVGKSNDVPMDQCDKLIAAFNLTEREGEILALLALGRSQPYIRERLLLSKSTVSTHVTHIYRKCGVHSKQELIDLLESLS